MSSLIPVAIVALLILLNGFFVAAEFAIVGISRMEVDRAIRQKKRGAKLLQWFLADPLRQDRFIATAQLGITAASLGLGMYGEHKLALWIAAQLEGWGGERWIAAHTIASVAAISVLTYFHIVVGEMVPKALALQRPTRTSLGVVYIMRAMQLTFYPLVIGLNGIGNLLLRLVGITRSAGGAEQYRTPEEIDYIVRESQAEGVLRKKSARVVSELLDFGNLKAAEVMVPRVRIVGLPMDLELEEVREALEHAPHTRYPVFDSTLDNIVGMLHIRDALRWAQRGGPLPRERFRPVPHLPGTATMDEVLGAMRRTGVQMVVVMDEHGGTAGILTLEDLFEEVVGDITERAGERPEIIAEDDDVIRADGAARLNEIGEVLGVALEHEEVDTVSGLVLALLRRPPARGDVVEYDRVRFEVVEVRGNGVGACRASIIEDEDDEDDAD